MRISKVLIGKEIIESKFYYEQIKKRIDSEKQKYQKNNNERKGNAYPIQE